MRSYSSLFPDERRRKGDRRVTLRAIQSKCSTMHILGLVAGITSSRQACLGNIFLAMAIMATSLCMGSRKGKPGLFIMIERNFLPAIRRMAALAGRSQAANMRVVGPMAIDTSY